MIIGLESFLYHYKARVVSVYDGDTVTLDIDHGRRHWQKNVKCRLYGIDTPEVRGEERLQGLVVRDWLRNRLPSGTEVIIKTHRDKTGKYGRDLVTIFHECKDINQLLVDLKMAEERIY